MQLFDKFTRTDTSYSKYQTSRFGFLNQSAQKEPTIIRKVLTDWYSDFPKDQEAEFIGRFRSNDNKHFLGALLELYTFQFFRSSGFV